MPNKIDALYAEVSKTYDVGSIQDFQNYLADPKKRQLFFKDVIAPEYDVKSLDEFEQAYGLKKKESVSPSQQKKGATSSATGAMGPDGAPVPSAKKGPSLQEQLQSGINLAASAAVASSKPGFTPVPKEEADKALYGKAKVKEGTLGLSGGRTKDVIISSLNEDFGKLGVRFEQPQNPISRSMGDIVATADNGQSITIQASSDGKAAESESKRLQSFLMGNSAGVEKEEVTPIEMLKMMQGGIAENEQEKFKRVYTPEMINETVKFVNDEVTKANKKLQDISGQIDEINNEAARLSGIMGSATPEDQSKIKDLTDRYDLLISEFDREKNNAQVISRLGSEGINIAAGEHVKLLEKQGSFGKSIYNHTINMIGDTVNGVFQMASLGVMDKGAAYAQDLTNQFKEDFKYAGTETYEENSNMAMKVLFSMPEWLPMAAMAPEVAMAFMFNQGVGRRMEEVNSNEETKNLSQAEKLAMVAPMAYIEAQLEKLGFGAWFNKNKGLASSIVLKAVSNVSPKAGVAGITKLINTEINNLAVKGLLNVSGAMLAEAETESLQYVTENAMRELYNVAEGRQIFKQPQLGSEAWAKELSDNAIMGAMGASFVSGPINIAQQTANYVVGKSNTNQTFGIVKDLLNDNVAESSMITQLNAAVNDGKLSKEKAQNTLYNFREAKAIARDLPEGLSEDNQRKAFDLIAEKRKLTKQIEGKDPSLVDKQKTRITAIDQELKNISNAVQEQTTSEVPVQPGAAVSGEVAQGEPQAEPQVVTEEGQAQKDEIEKRRQDELDSVDVSKGGKVPLEGYEEFYKKVNEKYDAELAALKGPEAQAQKEVIPAGKRLFNEPNPETVEISKAYKEKNGIVEGEGVKIEAVDVDNASKIADAFEALEDSPNDPEVQDAYNAMADETAKQHQDIIDAGYEVEIWDGEGEPYANAQEMIDDVKNNKHMYIFSTEQGFGDEPITDEQRKQNKLLQDSGLKDKNGKPLLYNDMFRFVHDFFGHTERGNGFGPVGEENAWDVHARMYSPKARRAMTTETRGQNSWVNFGPQMRNEDGSLKKKGDPGYLSPKDRAFAPQKMALMPEEFTQIKEVVSGFDQAVNNSAQSLKVVAPDLKIIVAENTEDAQLQIAEALSAVAPSQAADVAEGFTTETRGQTVFVNGKPFAIVLDKSQADTVTIGHEVWETMLNDAFGDDQAKFKEFRDGIDRQLRLNGFEDIAKALTDFSNQRGYEDVKYSEYMAELGGMLVADGFKKGSLDAKQKSLLQKIGDVINKFAQLFTGKKQFLDEATPDDILGFMITISNKVAKGEDVSQFFRGKESAAKPSVETRSQQAAIEILDGPKFDNKLKEDVASYLNSLRDSEIPPNSSREELMDRFINNVYEEVGYYLYSKPDARSAGLTWYIEDMVEFANKVKVVLPALSDENQYKLFLTVLAFTSSGTNPNQNLLYAYNLWNNSNDPKNFEFSKNWAEKKLSFIDKKGKPVASGVIVKETAKEYTVELVDSLGRTVVDKKGNKKYEKVSKASMKPGYPKPTGYTNRGEIIVGQLEKLEKLYADLGSINAVVKWLETPHPIAELRKYNESVPDVNGKGPGKTNKEYDPKKNAEGERNGAFIFGEKIGSFYQNMIGIGETITMDLWWSRTWNRYMGTMINTVSGKKEIQEVPRSDRERNIMREAVKMVAEDLNLQVSELQAAIWYFEQELWTKSGNESPSYSYVTAIDDLTKKLKVDEETRTKLRAAEADLTEAEKRRQNAAERAAAVVASKGGELPKVKVTTKSQKSVPAVVDEVLTDDGKGNYVFVHYSDELRDTIKPMSGSKKNFTSREEVSAISAVGGVAMYYTKQGQVESGVGNVPHTVLVPKDKVYFYGSTEKGTVSHDPEGFEEEARQRFQAYRNRGNEDRPTKYAFDANNSAAWVTKVAAENGYDMLVTNWGGPKSYRAQTTKALKPEAEYTGFKQIPEPTYEVGDEIFLYGRYATVVAVDGNTLSYESPNDFGRFDSGKFTLSPYTSNKIMLIEKAKPTITVRAQKKDTYTNQQYGEMSRNGVVFHGGSKSIDKLDPSKVKGGFRAVYGWGVYFAGTIYKASDYGDMITFLDSKQLNFLNLYRKVDNDLLSELTKIKDKSMYYDMFVRKLKDMIGININEARLRMGDFIRWDYNELWSQMFMDAGYDGFNQADNEYIVFNIEKADQAILEDPLAVTTKSQKVVVNTIPGYERMMGEVEGILDKTMNRTGSYNQATANAVGYIQKSAVYERADDSQREQIIRDFVKLRGEKFKVAPSVGKILGQIKDTKKVTVNEKTALKDQIKLEAKAAKDAVAFVKQLRMQISNTLRGMAGRGVISAKQASTILARYDRMNILNPDMRDRFVDYMANVFQSAEYADKVKEATKLRKTIRKAAKNPDNQAESSKLAKTFAEIDPSRVENIDDYINNAEQILKSVSRKTGDVKMRSLVNMTDMVSYIDKEIQEQRKQIKNEILSKYQDLVDAGVLDSKMTINEINKVVAAIEENEDESAAKAKEAKAAVKQMMDEVSPILLQIARTGEDPFTGDPIDLTQDEKSAIVKLAKMDLDNLSLAEAVKALEYANNFIANGVTSGIVGMVDLYEGSLNAEKLAKKGFKSIPFKKYFSKGAGRIWAEQIASLPMLNKLMWGSTSRALEVSEASGVTGVSNGKAKAIKIVEKAVKQYVATFSKTKDFLSSENVVERGMLAFVSRTVIGDEFQVQDEFNRRKSLIEETIQALKDPENSTDAEIKKGEAVEKVYNKILKDAKNANEVRANVSEVNKKAVDWWVNEWSKHYDRMDEVSRNVYNTLLSRDSNFTPDRFQLKEVSPAAEEDFDSGFFGNFENVSTEKSGSLKENKRIKNLPQNKNGVKTRIVNLDFDVNNVNALTNAMVDVETAGSVMQMKGFVTSKDFSKLFASKEDKNLYKKRLVSYVNRAKGQGYVDQSELKTLNRLVNAVASFGTAKALFSLSQPFKQSIPPLFNTLVQTGRLDLGTLMVGGFSFIDRTGYPIANRGISSQGELKSINRQLVEAEKNLLLRGVDGVAAYSNLMLELTLKYPDIMTARSSWLSFYKKGLKKEGIKTSGINWNTHEVNKKAADYAQMMVDSQQNISDSDMQGEFMASKDPAKAFLRRAIFPLMTFVLNQKTRIWADIRTLSNKAVTTTEDRQEAALSLAGALVELGAFSAISYAANSMLWEVAMNILAAVSGEDDDDDREEEKKKMILRRSAYTAQNFMKDFFVPPIPGADLLASKGINYILDETNLSSEIPADWFGIEDDRVKFRLYDKENQGYLDMLGTQGIALEKALELADYYDMAIDGTFKEESYGTKREKQILEGDADMARINAAIMTGYYGGLLPADVAYIVGQINKKIKKRAEVVEEED